MVSWVQSAMLSYSMVVFILTTRAVHFITVVHAYLIGNTYAKVMLNFLIQSSNFTIRIVDLEIHKDAWNKEAVYCDLLWNKVIPFHHNYINFSGLLELLAAVLSVMKQPLILLWMELICRSKKTGLPGYRKNQIWHPFTLLCCGAKHTISCP